MRNEEESVRSEIEGMEREIIKKEGEGNKGKIDVKNEEQCCPSKIIIEKFHIQDLDTTRSQHDLAKQIQVII